MFERLPSGAFWVGTEAGLYQQMGDGWNAVADVPIRAICPGNGGDVWYTDGGIVLGGGMWNPECEIRDMLSLDHEPWLATDQGLVTEERRWTTADGLLSDDVRSFTLDGAGHLWIATAAGISIFDCHETWYSLTGKNGLPYKDTRQIVNSPNGDRWIATGIGAACYKNGRWEYYAGKRWLPSDEVTAMAVGTEGEAWIGTTEGLSRIEKKPYDFEKKAELFEKRITARHRRHGFVAECHLETPGDVNSFVYEATDNDGLWTALYVAAESFRYAVTGDQEARERAQESIKAMMALEEKTTIDGFPARALVRK